MALSKDERTVCASYYMGDTVRKIDRVSGKVLAEVSVSDPDNLTWTDEGNLLVASHQGNLIEKLYCLISSGGACIFRFGVYELDANTLASKPVIVHKGQPMGGVTVATQVNQHLYLGSFSGNRVMRIPYRL